MSVEFSVENKVAYIQLNRPKQRNAQNKEMLDLLDAALERVETCDTINAAIIFGADPSFCAGSDLTELGALDLDGICDVEKRKAAFLRRISLCPKPIIAAVQGYAVGGGAFLAAACDVVVAAENVKFKGMEVPNGWITPWGFHALNARMAPRHAQRAAWGYKFITATEALRIGLVDEVVALEDLFETARTIAEELAALPPVSVQATKRWYLNACLAEGEAEDAKLNSLFRQHCQMEAAQETFKKFEK
ncbi:enoyl-CoA hydratase [Pseudovibrio denitrificans]|uniref:Enoyl-CoA hydratase n=1 Tax=Pseudovibrio denitrificans TaxID=258256 RepID=A0A1I7DT45_9HYPH|nr:enoyl-CoA hydratase/isomerase family protein [Pseudovibrio denitrificans]SFU14881.1 enoyl-CoA hydratase [Pseudovibrio denitrificans]